MVRFHGTTPLLKAADLDATIGFYTTVLGFELAALWPENAPTFCILDRGGAHLMFATDADWDAPGAPPSLTGQIHFDVSDVRELHSGIRRLVQVLWGPEVYRYGRREFSIRDPNGYRLVFSEPTNDPVTAS